MSALGQKQTCAAHKPMSALPPIATGKADISLERAKGIEPSYAAWEAAVLPLNYAREPSALCPWNGADLRLDLNSPSWSRKVPGRPWRPEIARANARCKASVTQRGAVSRGQPAIGYPADSPVRGPHHGGI